MTAVYRKRGAVVRWENGVVVRVVESGQAFSDGATFRCAPSGERPLAHVDAARVIAAARDIESLAAGRVTIERLLVSEGTAEHELADRRWADRSERVHLSLVRGSLRVLVDLGAFTLDDVSMAVDALARAEERELEVSGALALAPIVSAALLPSLGRNLPPEVELWQSSGGLDGRGEPIVETRIDGTEAPNWYRPSYRMQPVRMPMNLRLRHVATSVISADARAVALLAPVHGHVLRVLVDDGSSVRPAVVPVTRIRAVADGAVWYPYGAGSFGAEMVL
jgi:hypothetical protein